MKSSENRKRKRRGRHKHQDLISRLPDDILVSIISHLNVKVAAATSFLSSRWRYLPTYLTRLNFPSFIPKFQTLKHTAIQQILTKSFPRNTNTVNRVLDSHVGGLVKEFRVHMYSLEGANINRWFEFALAKDVEIIQIHMDNARHYYKHVMGHYSLRANLNLMGETLICLKELSLLGIDVNDEDIQLLLDKFPLLESLSITKLGFNSLRHVSIVGHSSSKLKHLEISNVRNFEIIEIDIDNLVNLVSLWLFKLVFSLNIKNVPKLIEFSLSDNYKGMGARILSGMPSSIHHQLQTLKIFIDSYFTMRYEERMPLQLNCLKNLELHQHRMANIYIAHFNPFYIIRACPSLEKLEIKFSGDFSSSDNFKVNEYHEEYTVLDGSAKKLCPFLKKMKIFRFMGSPLELKFVFSILKNVSFLEELVVETWVENKKDRKLAREHAQRYFGPRALKVVVI